MNITANQIVKKKKVGHTEKGEPVFELATKGGLNLIISGKAGGGFETLGTGPHRAVARHIAEKYKSIVWTELSKADPCELEDFEQQLPKYQSITEQLREEERSR
jgi:hypothetical protein